MSAAELTVFPVDSFGKPKSGCRVSSFKTFPKDNEERRDYTRRFRGLVASRLPLGEYDLLLDCGGRELFKSLVVKLPRQFEVVASRDRITIVHDVKPKLTIKLDHPVVPGEVWWVRLVGIFNGELQIDEFAPPKREATIYEPEVGRHLVMVLSSTGKSCAREVDMYEDTESWTTKPATCAFTLDKYAHLVPTNPAEVEELERWHKEIRADREAWLKRVREFVDSDGKKK